MSSASPADASAPPTAGSLPRPAQATTLVVGLGNPLLGDDGVGWAVVDDLERRLATASCPPAETDRSAVGGLGLMERLVGHDRVILVDATCSDDAAPGTVSWGPLGSFPTARPDHLDSSHDVSLQVALAAGRALGARLPVDVHVVGIVASRVDVFGEGLSPEVAAAVPRAVEVVLGLLAGDRR